MSGGALFNESTVVGGYVSVVGILLEHVDLQFNFLLFILVTSKKHKCPLKGFQEGGKKMVQ